MENKKENAENIAGQEIKEEACENKQEEGGLNLEKMPAEELRILTGALINENTELEKKVAELTAERDGLKKISDKAAELSAMYSAISRDFDAYRKRNSEIEAVSKDNAVIDTGIKIVPVYENLKRALDATQDEKTKEGINLIYRQFSEILAGMNIKEFGAEGDVFDPYKHNALMAVETDKKELKGKIKQIFSFGYIYKDKVIKQSQVVVYKD